MKLSLDTNAYAAMRRGHPGVAELIRRSEEVLLSSVVVGELTYGFRRGTRYRKNMRELREFLADLHVSWLPVTLDTADRYGRIAVYLRERGTPIPSNDIWIAAHAMEHGADLVSADGHFDCVAGLAWVHPDG